MIKSLNLADLLLYVVEKDNMHLNDPFCIFTKYIFFMYTALHNTYW